MSKSICDCVINNELISHLQYELALRNLKAGNTQKALYFLKLSISLGNIDSVQQLRKVKLLQT